MLYSVLGTEPTDEQGSCVLDILKIAQVFYFIFPPWMVTWLTLRVSCLNCVCLLVCKTASYMPVNWQKLHDEMQGYSKGNAISQQKAARFIKFLNIPEKWLDSKNGKYK